MKEICASLSEGDITDEWLVRRRRKLLTHSHKYTTMATPQSTTSNTIVPRVSVKDSWHHSGATVLCHELFVMCSTHVSCCSAHSLICGVRICDRFCTALMDKALNNMTNLLPISFIYCVSMFINRTIRDTFLLYTTPLRMRNGSWQSTRAC